MPKKNDFKLDVVSVRLVKDAPIYSEHTFNNPADIAAVMGDCMCQFWIRSINSLCCVSIVLFPVIKLSSNVIFKS
jgi:hypothetical protein